MSILDTLQQQIGDADVQRISQQIGATPAQTQSAIQAALPMMVAGMAGQAQRPEGAQGLHQAMSAFGGGASAPGVGGGLPDGALGAFGGGDGGGLGGVLGGMLGGAGGAGGGLGGILGSVLGQHTGTVEDGVAKTSGLNGDQTRKLLMMLAPIVLAMLARRHGGADPGALGGALERDAREAQEHTERNQPQMGGILGQILKHVTSPKR
ncbi:MAG: DUF937 domain-containing protein [Gemmatimonadaceae bacterium]